MKILLIVAVLVVSPAFAKPLPGDRMKPSLIEPINPDEPFPLDYPDDYPYPH
jgi:hypothetical protein